jgi:thiamine-phosphate pyrophosphorylase
MRPPLPRLHAVTDERVARRPDLPALASSLAAAGGADLAFHARGHALSGHEHFDLAVRLSACPSPLFLNDRLDIALAVGAAGVQLPQGGLSPRDARRLGPNWWIGSSVHDLTAATAARAEGADYLLVGPVFSTATHPGAIPLGVAGLAPFVALGLPVVAIGGVTPARIAELAGAGIHGVAAIRGIWEAADPAAVVREMIEGFR